MEKSLEQLKRIEKISRRTRRHHTHLNLLHDQNLRLKLENLNKEREQNIVRATSQRLIEEERKQLVHLTIKQIAREKQQKLLVLDTAAAEEETIQELPKQNPSRPSSSIRMPSSKTSCYLFSNNCQLYPCQPVHQYTSFIKKENDKTLKERNSSSEKPKKSLNKPHFNQLLLNMREKQYDHDHRQLASAIQNQQHLVNRHISMKNAMTRLDEQSRLLREQLAEKRPGCYGKERRHQLSQAIQQHLEISAKFCS